MALMLGATVFAAIGAFVIVFEGMAFLGQGVDAYRGKVADQVRQLDGLYVKAEPHKLFFLNIVSSFVMFVVVFVSTGSAVVSLAVCPIGMFVSKLWIGLARKRRLRLFDEQFVDAVGVISSALKSGLSLQQAIARVAAQYPPPLSQELSMVGKEAALGVPLEQALINLGRRVGSQDLDLFVTATNVVRDVGGNLSEMFDTIADTLRERNTIQGKIRALTSQGRMQGIVIGLMPVALGVILYRLDPNLVAPLFNDPIGWTILFVIVLFEAIGAFVIAKIVRIDV